VGLFFVLGAGDGGFRRSLTSALSGMVAAVVVMVLGPALADPPDFWRLAVAIGVAGAGLVLLSATRADELLAAGAVFVCGATVLLWWFVTGLDGFVPDGKGPHTVEGRAARLIKTRWPPESRQRAPLDRRGGVPVPARGPGDVAVRRARVAGAASRRRRRPAVERVGRPLALPGGMLRTGSSTVVAMRRTRDRITTTNQRSDP
jgi:hypothetical protein